MNHRSTVALAIFLIGMPAFAAGPCTQHITRGSWMYTCEGTLPAPTQTPARIVGRCTASGTAFWNCEGTVNLGGQIIPQTLAGQAHNEASCVGNISYAQTLGGADAGTLDIRYVIFDGGDAISGLPLNTGGVLSCSLKRIDGGNQ